MENNPYHEGEIKIQNLTGERNKARANSVVIKPEILSGAFDFISKQTMIWLGTQNQDGSLLISLISGAAGFIQAHQANILQINLAQTTSQNAPFLANLETDPRIGTLLIDLESRRRLKINGRLLYCSKNLLEIAVIESFPLCPKYIQRRKIEPYIPRKTTVGSSHDSSGTRLGKAEEELIGRCDTMFVATSNPRGGIDVSHRGGEAGFVKVLTANHFRCPDYSGNGMFNSFGNLVLNNNASALFLDFTGKESLHVSGVAQVLLDQIDDTNESGGTKRFWTFDINNWRRSALPIAETEFLDYSPHNPKRER